MSMSIQGQIGDLVIDSNKHPLSAGFPSPSPCQRAEVTYDRCFDLVTALWLWFGHVMKLVTACWAGGDCPYGRAFFGLFSLDGFVLDVKYSQIQTIPFHRNYTVPDMGKRSGAAVSAVNSKRGGGRGAICAFLCAVCMLSLRPPLHSTVRRH